MSDTYDIVDRSHQLDGDVELLSAYYGQWATSYEQATRTMGYQGPRVMAELLTELLPHYLPNQHDITALDAGCGTGLVGPPLVTCGVTAVDGVDINHAMVTEAAGRGVYRMLASGVDLNRGLREFAADSFDLTVSCGVFTTGHVQPLALDGLLRVTRPGGLVLATTSRRYLEDTDFEELLEARVAQRRVHLIKCLADHAYVVNESAHYWILRLSQ